MMMIKLTLQVSNSHKRWTNFSPLRTVNSLRVSRNRWSQFGKLNLFPAAHFGGSKKSPLVGQMSLNALSFHSSLSCFVLASSWQPKLLARLDAARNSGKAELNCWLLERWEPLAAAHTFFSSSSSSQPSSLAAFSPTTLYGLPNGCLMATGKQEPI